MRAIVGDGLRARAKTHHRNDDRRGDRAPGRGLIGAELDFVVHHAANAGHRRGLFPEPREFHLDASLGRFQPRQHLVEQSAQAVDGQRIALLVDDRD